MTSSTSIESQSWIQLSKDKTELGTVQPKLVFHIFIEIKHLAKTGVRGGGIISRSSVGSSKFQRRSSHMGHQGTRHVVLMNGSNSGHYISLAGLLQ